MSASKLKQARGSGEHVVVDNASTSSSVGSKGKMVVEEECGAEARPAPPTDAASPPRSKSSNGSSLTDERADVIDKRAAELRRRLRRLIAPNCALRSGEPPKKRGGD